MAKSSLITALNHQHIKECETALLVMLIMKSVMGSIIISHWAANGMVHGFFHGVNDLGHRLVMKFSSLSPGNSPESVWENLVRKKSTGIGTWKIWYQYRYFLFLGGGTGTEKF